MRVLFLTDNFPPEVNAPATRTYEHCIEWVKQGAEVTIITCAPNFPQGKLFSGYKNKLWQREEMDGIKIIRVWSFISPNIGTFKRIIDFTSYAFFAFWASLFVKTDIIVATSPQFFTAVAGWLSSLFKRKPWVMEVRDLWPESIRVVGARKIPEWILAILEKLELHLYRSANLVVVVTDAFKHNLVKRGIDRNKIAIITNGVDQSKFFPRIKNLNLINRLELEGKFVVGYMGTHGLAHKLDFILECAKKVSPQIHFLFIGDGAEKQNLKAYADELQLSNVTLLDPVAKNEISKYISITDLALVPLKKSYLFRTVIPSKIFENAAMQKPILLGVEGECKVIIETYKAGVAFEPENEQDFIEKLELLAKDKTFYDTLLPGCSQLATDYDRGKRALAMLRLLSLVASNSPVVIQNIQTKTPSYPEVDLS